jgi:hypothetical protein
MVVIVLLAALFMSVPASHAQTAQVTGRVTDSTDAVIPDVAVNMISISTGISRKTSTNDLGYYTIPLLQPGSYRMVVQKQGFRSISRAPIQLSVDQIARIDLRLEVGEVTETVDVSEATPLLEPETSSLGEVIGGRKVLDLPLNGRNPLSLVALVPGVVPQGQSGQAAAATPNFNGWGNYQISGALANASEMMWDGAPLNGGRVNTVRIVPTGDSIHEFKVQSNNFSAEFGRTAGGIVSLSTRSGTNEFHGTAYEFLRNKVLNANTFFNNARGVDTPAFTQNQFGVTAGGPVIFPGLYNGRGRTFIFGSYEGFRQSLGNALLFTVPTERQRLGDFSQTLNSAGSAVSIYDPLTTRPDPANPGRFIRDPFQGNIIPQSRIDPVASKYVERQLWALPNRAGDGFTRINNWAGNSPVRANSDALTVRADQVVSDRQKLFARYSWLDTGRGPNGAFGSGIAIQPGDEFRDATATHQALLEDIYSFSPNTVMDLRYSFLRFAFDRSPGTQGIDLTTLGFPSSFGDQIGNPLRHVPNQFVSGMATLFGGGVFIHREDFHTLAGSLTRILGRHSMKMGGELRVVRYNFGASNESSGAFRFNGSYTAIDPFRPAGTGFPFADFLLGFPNSGNVGTPALLAQQRSYRGLYFQDDLRLHNRLTLNLGLRYDQDGDWTERFDRQLVFQSEAQHPLAQQTGLALRGNLAAVNTPQRTSRTSDDVRLNQWAPRFGLAFQVAPRTVIRGGYGIFWIPASLDLPERTTGPLGAAPTLFVSSLDGGLTPANRMSNPFPTGIVQPPSPQAASTLFMGTDVQLGVAGYTQNGYAQQWNLNLQQEVAGETLIEAAYAGLKGTNLPVRFQPLNQLPPELLSQGSSLFTQVANPFAGLIRSGALAGATIPRGQLLLPYPHFVGVFAAGASYGSSTYHSMQFKLEKRFRTGAGLLAAYTISKLISNVDSQTAFLEPQRIAFEFGPQNSYNPAAERSLSSFDTPQRLVVSFTLDLPFGRGRRLATNLTGAASKLVSGWAVNGIYSAQRGFPLFVTTQQDLSGSYMLRGGVGHRPNSSGQSAELSGRPQDRLSRWFNTSTFSQPQAFTFGNVSRTLPDVRTHGINNTDFSIFKNTYFGSGEELNLQFRAEFFNLFNRTQFGYPGQVFGTAQFGVVSSQLNQPRLIQFALKVIF